MTVGTYAERCYVHPDRYGSRKTNGDDLWFVLHTSEGSEGNNSAEALCSFMGQPGDRVGTNGRYGASYHAVFDTDRIIPAVPYNVVSYSAGGGNSRGRHAVFPGKAGQTREQWLDPVSRGMIRQAAHWAVDQGIGWLFPNRRLTVAEVQSSAVHGLCDHYDITRAFRKSDHWDVGPGFPWDVLAADITAIVYGTTPPPPPPIGVPDVFHPINPHRNSDTRHPALGLSGGLPAGMEHTFALDASIFPANTTAVALNVAVVPAAGRRGWLQMWMHGSPRPTEPATLLTSVVNFEAAGAHNGAINLGIRDRKFNLFLLEPAHVIIDISGFWTA